jgi:hypothetical protein
MIKEIAPAFGTKHPAFRPFHAGGTEDRVSRVPDESAASECSNHEKEYYVEYDHD